MSSPDHAIIIGLNRYQLGAYNLTAPVPDALDFARWVTEPGAGRAEATKASLTLLLSPLPSDDGGPLAGLAELATTTSIRKALSKYSKAGTEKPRRLWLFYAGHAIAPYGASPDQTPLLLPPDCDDIEDYQKVPTLPFDVYRKALLSEGPAEQIMFIDACRAQLPNETGLYGGSLLFDTNPNQQNNAQALLCATTNGSFANQIGRGLFAQAVLKGLKGRAELGYDVFNEDYNLTFPALTKYVVDEVQRLAANAREKITQVPDPLRMPDLLLARFKQRPKATITLQVRPTSVLKQATVRLRVSEYVIETEGPPARPSVSWPVQLGQVAYTVEAPGYDMFRDKVVVSDDIQVPVTLRKSSGLEKIAEPPLSEIPRGTADLTLVANDRLVQFELFDNRGNSLRRGAGAAEIECATGLYRVDWSIPGGGLILSQRLELFPGARTVQYKPASTLSSALQEKLGAAGIRTEGGVSHPSERFGEATLQRVGSVLSWAAMAVRYTEGNGDRLRSLGVSTVDTSRGESWVQVLVGDAVLDEKNLLDGLTVRFGRGGNEQALATSAVSGLTAFAEQAQAVVPTGGASLVVSGRQLADLALPVPHAPGWISVVIISREAGGQIEIHRYLHEAHPQRPFSDEVRVREQQWRALEQRVPVTTEEARALLQDDALDPLTTVIVGYRLWLAGRMEEWHVDASRVAVVPDAHILAAMAGGADRDAVDKAMLSLGPALPLVGAGFSFLHRWLERRSLANGLPPPIPARSPLYGALWTSFDAREGRALVATNHAIPAAVLRGHPVPWAKVVQPVVDETVRIDHEDPKQREIKGTAFRVGPSTLLTMRYIFDGARDARPGDRFDEWSAASESGRSAIGPLLAVSERGFQWGPKLLALALLNCQTSAGAAPASLTLSFAQPYVGQRIAVIGFPKASPIPAGAITTAFTQAPGGQKYVLPGEITVVEPNRIIYAAFTLGGTSGAPVVDLDTGHIVGVHFGGQFDPSTGIKYGFAVPLALLEGEAFWLSPHISANTSSKPMTPPLE